MRIVIYILIIFFNIQFSFSQFKVIQENGGSDVGKGISLENGGILYVANPFNKETSNLNIKIYQLDLDGSILRSKHLLNEKYYETVKDVIETSNGDFLICGDRRLPGVTDRSFFLMKVDRNFNVVYDSTYGTELSNNRREEGRKIIEINENRFLVYYISYTGLIENVFMMVDSNGKRVWGRYLNQNLVSSYPDLKFEKDKIKLSGFTRKENDYMLTYLDLDTLGEITHSKVFDRYKTNACYVVGKKRFDYQEEKIFFNIMRDSCKGGIFNILVSKVNNDDNIILNKIFDFNYKSYILEDVISTFDSGYLMVGNIKEYLENGYSVKNRGLFFYRLDKNLDSVWHKEILFDEKNYIESYSFFKASGEYYYFTGNHVRDYVIGRLNKYGEFEEDFLSNIDINNDIKVNLDIEVSSESNYISFANNSISKYDFKIYDLLGRNIMNISLNSHESYQIYLKTGVYLIYGNNSQKSYHRKIIIN